MRAHGFRLGIQPLPSTGEQALEVVARRGEIILVLGWNHPLVTRPVVGRQGGKEFAGPLPPMHQPRLVVSRLGNFRSIVAQQQAQYLDLELWDAGESFTSQALQRQLAVCRRLLCQARPQPRISASVASPPLEEP